MGVLSPWSNWLTAVIIQSAGIPHPNAHPDAWIGPSGLSIGDDAARELFIDSNFHKLRFAERLRSVGWSGRLPALKLKPDLRDRSLRITVFGDSIGAEIYAACRLLSPAWQVEYVLTGFLCGPTFVRPSCAPLERQVHARFAQGTDVVILSAGFQHLIPASVRDTSTAARREHQQFYSTLRKYDSSVVSGHRSPFLMFDRSWRALLAMASRVAPNISSRAPQALVVCTPMELDGRMMLGDPWKPDWDRMYPPLLAEFWAEHSALTAHRMGVSRPGLQVLPLWRLARRYRWVRCDGMHFASYTCTRAGGCHQLEPDPRSGLIPINGTACHPNLGAYHGVLASAVGAAQKGVSLEDEISWQRAGGSHGSWAIREGEGELTRYVAGEMLPSPRECYTEGRDVDR